MTSHDSYIRSEWKRFFSDQTHWESALNYVAEENVSRVLDVGCGAGQQLVPFAVDRKAFGVGIDIAEECGSTGRALLTTHYPAAKIFFAQANASNLPFKSESFDLVLCRIALPYMDNDKSLTEMARVMTPAGTLILKIHHWRFYVSDLFQSVRRFDPLLGIHALRVFTVGAVYHLTGHQMNNRITRSETYQTRWLLDKKLKEIGLRVTRETDDSQSSTPSFVIHKTARPSTV